MNKEIDIIEMIKSRRFFKLAFRELLPASKRMELKEKSRYLMVDPDTDGDDMDDDKEVENDESILDKIERELNDDVNLTDGFYSSDDDGDAFDAERLKKNDQIKEADQDSHQSNLPSDGQIDFQDSDQEEVKNFFP